MAESAASLPNENFWCPSRFIRPIAASSTRAVDRTTALRRAGDYDAGLAPGVTAGDCGMILFVDTRAGVIGAAHPAGRRADRRGRGDDRRDGETRRALRRLSLTSRSGRPSARTATRGRPRILRAIPGRLARLRVFRPGTQEGHHMLTCRASILRRASIAQESAIRETCGSTPAYDDACFFSYCRTRRIASRTTGGSSR